MATIPQIRNRLLEGFPEPQADLLAHVFVESHDELVTKAELNELTGVVKELAAAQNRTEQRVEELTAAQNRTEQRVEELAAAQNRTEQRVEQLAAAQNRTEQRVEELAAAQNRTEQRVEELAAAQNRTEQSIKKLTESQDRTQREVSDLTKTVDRLAAVQEKMLIRLDMNDGRSFELFLRTHLPAYLGRHMRKCRVISAEQLLDTVEDRLTDVEVDDLLRSDLVATAEVDGTPMHLVGEVSCTADKEDIVRAARRAEHLRKAGIPALAFVACEAITHKTAEFASREKVRVLIEGRLLPETA